MIVWHCNIDSTEYEILDNLFRSIPDKDLFAKRTKMALTMDLLKHSLGNVMLLLPDTKSSTSERMILSVSFCHLLNSSFALLLFPLLEILLLCETYS